MICIIAEKTAEERLNTHFSRINEVPMVPVLLEDSIPLDWATVE